MKRHHGRGRSQDEYLDLINAELIGAGRDQITLRTLRKYIREFGLYSDREFAVKTLRDRAIPDAKRKADIIARFKRRGHVVEVLKFLRVPRQNATGETTRVRCRYRLLRTKVAASREFCGLVHEQDYDWAGKSNPTLKSLTPESRERYLKELCSRNPIRLTYIEEISDPDAKIVFLFEQGKFQGYRAKTRLNELREGVTEDPRFLLNDNERMSWLRTVLPGCDLKTNEWPGGRGGRGLVDYTCPNGHENSIRIGSILKCGGDHIICQKCNNIYSIESKLIDNAIFRRTVVCLYLVTTVVHDRTDDMLCDHGENCPYPMALKIGFYGTERLANRSRKYILDIPFFRWQVARGIAYVVEQKILEAFAEYRITRILESHGHRCDGYTEMIDMHADIHKASTEVDRLIAETINQSDESLMIAIRQARRSNYRRSNSYA